MKRPFLSLNQAMTEDLLNFGKYNTEIRPVVATLHTLVYVLLFLSKEEPRKQVTEACKTLHIDLVYFSHLCLTTKLPASIKQCLDNFTPHLM